MGDLFRRMNSPKQITKSCSKTRNYRPLLYQFNNLKLIHIDPAPLHDLAPGMVRWLQRAEQYSAARKAFRGVILANRQRNFL